MPSSNAMRVLFGVILLLALANAVKTLQQPEALRFFGIAMLVATAVGVVGSVVALILTAIRRLSAR